MIEPTKTNTNHVLELLMSKKCYLVFWILSILNHLVFIVISAWLAIMYFIRNMFLFLAIVNILIILYLLLKLPFLYIKYNKDQKRFLTILSFYIDLFLTFFLLMCDLKVSIDNKLDEKEEERLLNILMSIQAVTCTIFFFPAAYHLEHWLLVNLKQFRIC